MTHHTPGPWSVFPGYDKGDRAGIEAGPDEFSIIIYGSARDPKDLGGIYGRTDIEAAANAALIAAAPDLLNALDALLAEYDGWSEEQLALRADRETRALIKQGRAARSKARGR